PLIIGDLKVCWAHLFEGGRGDDYLMRLRKATRGDPSCLKIKRYLVTDDLIPRQGYPRVEIHQSGSYLVRSIHDPKSIIFDSAMEKPVNAII
ncbi:MAG: hypothetical protein KKH83_01460, partial [Candidatus Margulisbacteria bacterium]|nr:hypothetical protein [Candidatus Margulisiibacteriota bacterium]